MRDVDPRALIGPPIRIILARMASSNPTEAQLDCLEAAFRASYDSEGWKMTPHYSGAAETLRRLKSEGRLLFIVSNKPRHVALRILEAEGTLTLFDEILTRDTRVPNAPPFADKQEMISILLPKWDIDAQNCLMVGDTIEDAEAASAAGMEFFLMTHGYGDVPLESKVPVALRVDRFSQLIAYIHHLSPARPEGAAH